MVRPTLEYSSAVWDPHKQKDTRLLEKVQRRAARYVTNNYTDRSQGTVTSMLEYLKWTSLEHRRQQIRLGMLYKINNGLVDINPASFFRHPNPRTTGRQRLYQEQTNTLTSFIPSSPTESVKGTSFLPLFLQPLESFLGRLGRSLHNLQPAPTSPSTSRSCT